MYVYPPQHFLHLMKMLTLCALGVSTQTHHLRISRNLCSVTRLPLAPRTFRPLVALRPPVKSRPPVSVTTIQL